MPDIDTHLHIWLQSFLVQLYMCMMLLVMVIKLRCKLVYMILCDMANRQTATQAKADTNFKIPEE